MKFLLSLILLLSIGIALAEVDGTSCDVTGLSSLASSACSQAEQDCENQAECSNALSLLMSEAERCGCDSECQSIIDESRLISSKCEADLEEEEDDDEDDEDDLEEDEDDEDDEDDDEDSIEDSNELDKKKKKKKGKSSKKGKKKKGKKGNKKLRKKLRKWKRKLRVCKSIKNLKGGSKKQCVKCCVKSIVLYAVTEEFDLASVPEEVRTQREQIYEDLMIDNAEKKFSELSDAGLVEDSEEEELEEDDEDEEDEDEIEENDDLEEEDEEEQADESDDLDKKKKKKKKKNKKKKKKSKKKKKKKAMRACKKQLGLVLAYDLASTSEALTPEQAKQSLTYQSLDFEEIEEPLEEDDDDEEDDDEITLDEDLDQLEKKKKKKKKKKTKVSRKKARRAARKCCPNRVSYSTVEHKYIKRT